MIDVRAETHTHPRAFPLRAYRRLLVLAAHPDDEVYGCGGLLALAKQLGIEARVLVLSDGSQGGVSPDLVQQRRAESQAAAALLGHRFEFAELPDRGLRYDETLLRRVSEIGARDRPDLVLAPALSDYHPDHQAVALAAIAVFGRQPHDADLAFYETIGSLTQVTHLLDVSACYPSKREAMRCFHSQEAVAPYALRIEARDAYRASTLGPSAGHAEAYALAPLRQQGFTALIPLLDPLYRHALFDAAALPQDAPLVSVLVRSIGDPLLEQAIASVLAQTYRPLEIVVVAAHARDISPQMPHLSALPQLRQVVPSTPLDRPAAANVALRAARGRYLLFLDEDDLLLPDHIEKLASTLRDHPEVMAVHTGVSVVDPAGNRLRDYALTVQQERLLATNLLPIHAVLFDRRLVDEHGCIFDETLPLYEDWDFWLQVAQHTRYLAVPGVSALYRYRDRSGLHQPEGQAVTRALRERVIAKWRQRLGSAPFDAALAWHAMALDDLERSLLDSASKNATLAQEVETLRSDNVFLRQEVETLRSEKTILMQEGERLGKALEEIHASTSWRMTAPMRWVSGLARKAFGR